MGPTCVCMFLHFFVLAICFLVSSSNQMGNRGYLIAENIVCENCKCGTRDSKFVSHTDLLAQPSVHFIRLPPETWNLYPRSSRQNPTAPLGSPWFCLYCQFRIFQVPKLEVPTTNTAYFVGLCKGMSPPNVTFCGSSGPSNGQKSGQSNTAQRKILALLNQFLQMLRDRCLPDSGHWNARLDHGHPRFYLARRCVLKVSWACEDWEILRYDKSASKRERIS